MFVMNYIMYRYSVLIIFISLSGRKATDSTESHKTLQVLSESENVRMNCVVPNQLNGVVSWYFTYRFSESRLSENKWVEYDNSYEIEHDVPTNNYRLVIKIVNPLYEGVYRCDLRHTKDEYNIITISKVGLKVFQLPSSPRVECDIGGINFLEGDLITFRCNAFIGNVPGNIEMWMFDAYRQRHSKLNKQRVINVFERILKVNVTRNMDVFQCTVTHDLLPNGNLSCLTPQLNVNHPPEFFDMPVEREYYAEGNVKIPINVMSKPKARIYWRDKKDFLNITGTLNTDFSSLSISGLSERNNGTKVEITALNDFGSDTHSVILYFVNETMFYSRPVTNGTFPKNISNTKRSSLRVFIVIGVSLFFWIM